MPDNEEQQEGMTRIPLDGTYGAGPTAELTIVTKVGDQQREETFTVPYMLIDKKMLQGMCDINFILGYRVVKTERILPGLKELGL
jgi:hypothetical protein